MALLPVNPDALNKLGATLSAKFELRKTARKPFEEKCLQNLRQYRGVYDPNIVIPPGCSKSYPKLTRWKIVATVARLMAMLFPQQEKNYELQASKIANLSVEVVQHILDTLQQGGQPLTDEIIQKAVQTEAETRAANMAKKVDDDLQEINYPSEVRRVVMSATRYGPGLLKGPTTRTVKETAWKVDGTGLYQAYVREVYKPVYEYKSIWGYYPDLSAQDVWHQDGIFERDVYTRDEVRNLRTAPGFKDFADRIDYCLKYYSSGNHVLLDWEQMIWQEKRSDRSNMNQAETGKFVMITYTGDISGLEAQGAGLLEETADVNQSYQVVLSQIGNTIVKAALIPKEMAEVRLHHTFIFEEDDGSLLGVGLADILRDSQFGLCDASRAMFDEMSLLGTDLEVDAELLEDGETMDRSKNRTWRVRSDGSPVVKRAVQAVQMQNNLPSYLQVIGVCQDFADKESSLPPASMGDVTGGGSEALRTKGNASMFLGAASLPIRDTVRNFDNFTVSVISSLVAWNTKYAPDESRNGDANVIARGSTSLIAKEVLADSLDQLRATVTADEIDDIDARELFRERMLARDIPVDKVLVPKEVADQRRQAKSQQQQQQIDLQAEEITSKVRKNLADAFKSVADGKATDAGITLDTFNAVSTALETHDPKNSKPAPAPA